MMGHLSDELLEHSARIREQLSLAPAATAGVLVAHPLTAFIDHALPAALLAFNNQIGELNVHIKIPVM
jgi:hypothetical protein